MRVCVCMQGHTNSNPILRLSWAQERKERHSDLHQNHFPSQLRGWVFIPLVCTEIYKTLTPANPAATKTGKGQQDTGMYSQNTPTELTTKL